MKKYICLLVLPILSFSNFTKNAFSANVVEVSIVNSVRKEKTYTLNYNPDKVVIEVKSPELNKGETYTYEKNQKISYYPLLKQTVTTKLEDEEQTIFSILKKINENTENKENFDGYTFTYSKDNIKSIKTKDTSINFSNYVGIYPTKIAVNHDGNYIVYTLDNIK